MTVQRFNAVAAAAIMPAVQGKYVLASDYEKLLQQNTRMREAIEFAIAPDLWMLICADEGAWRYKRGAPKYQDVLRSALEFTGDQDKQLAELRGRQNLESQQKLADMAAENAALNSAIEAVQWAADNSEGIAGWHSNGDTAMWNEVIPEIFNIAIPNTDAYLNSVRAEGVDMFAAHQRAMIDKPHKNDAATSYASRCAVEYAAQLRAGKDGE